MKIAFLGAGNMGGAIVRAVVENQVIPPQSVIIYDKVTAASQRFATQYHTVVSESPAAAAAAADIIVIAVKPNVVPVVMEEIKDECQGKILVSIAAGVKVAAYCSFLGTHAKIVRTIPNLPAMAGAGATGLYFHNFTEEEASVKTFILDMFNAFGESFVVDKERMIDEMVAVTSSSPAYVCLMVEAMADGAVKAGFARKDAYRMAEQAILGTAKLLLEKDLHPAVLKDQICSPGGTTIAAVTSLEETGFRSSLQEAMACCSRKVFELGQETK